MKIHRYMDTVLKVLIYGGHYVRDDVVNSVTQSISESPEMYAFIGIKNKLLVFHDGKYPHFNIHDTSKDEMSANLAQLYTLIIVCSVGDFQLNS